MVLQLLKPRAIGLGSLVERFRPELGQYEDIYRNIHQNPELSTEERETAELVESHLRNLGVTECHTRVGYYGVVGVIRNGNGPVVMLRADMDALPIKEQTGLQYASKKSVTKDDGTVIPVMHACGHDIHVVCLLACAELLGRAKSHWHGTALLVFQPAEEYCEGAKEMVKAGLYDLVPKPDVLLGQHVTAKRAGTVQIRSGFAFAAVDCFDVRIHGKGGHGSKPERAKDPVLPACSIVLKLQTIVAKEVSPDDFAVVTCAHIHAGTGVNIFPDYADLKIGIRSFSPQVRERVVSAVQRVIHCECESFGLPDPPQITRVDDNPAIINDEEVVERLRQVFGPYFGDNLSVMERDTTSDDFALLAGPYRVPYAYYYFGGIEPKIWDNAEQRGALNEIPQPHTASYAPAIQPTIKTGIDAISLAALAYLCTDEGELSSIGM